MCCLEYHSFQAPSRRRKAISSVRPGFPEARASPLTTKVVPAHSRCSADICWLWAAYISFPFLFQDGHLWGLLSTLLILQETQNLCYRISEVVGWGHDAPVNLRMLTQTLLNTFMVSILIIKAIHIYFSTENTMSKVIIKNNFFSLQNPSTLQDDC